MKTMRNSTQRAQRTQSLCALCVLCVKKTLRAAGDALWLLWMLPGFVVAACAASAEEEHDARLKAIDGGAL